MSYSLYSFKGDYLEILLGCIMGVIKGDTRSLERGSHKDDEEVRMGGSA